MDGYFFPQGSDEELHYEVTSWRMSNGKDYSLEDGDTLRDSQLSRIDFIVVEVTSDERAISPAYTTIWGPFEDERFIEEVLSYDFGPDGSLSISPTASTQ